MMLFLFIYFIYFFFFKMALVVTVTIALPLRYLCVTSLISFLYYYHLLFPNNLFRDSVITASLVLLL
jgi:hypothetical protein